MEHSDFTGWRLIGEPYYSVRRLWGAQVDFYVNGERVICGWIKLKHPQPSSPEYYQAIVNHQF